MRRIFIHFMKNKITLIDVLTLEKFLLMINKKEYSLLLIQTVGRLFTKTRKFVDENEDILELTKDNPPQLLIEDKSKSSPFKFSIFNPYQDSNNKILFNIEFNPKSNISITARKVAADEKVVFTYLEQWTKLIRQYNEISLTPEENILKEYEKEFYDSFEIIDDDADTHPYEIEKQVMIHNYFVKVIEVLEIDNKGNTELIEEARQIKEDIPNMTKRTTIKRISSFFAKVRKKGLPLLKEVLELGKKEFFKRAITNGLDMISEITALL